MSNRMRGELGAMGMYVSTNSFQRRFGERTPGDWGPLFEYYCDGGCRGADESVSFWQLGI